MICWLWLAAGVAFGAALILGGAWLFTRMAGG